MLSDHFLRSSKYIVGIVTHTDEYHRKRHVNREVESAAYLAFAYAVEDPPYADSGKLPPWKSVSVT